MKKLLLITLIIASVANANAQKADGGDVKKNIVKLNLGGFIFKTASLQYERVLGKKISLALGVRFSPSRGIPSSLKSQLSSGASAGGSDALYTINNTKFGGYAITPEFRFYPGKKGAAKGFYLAPYFRYATYNMNVPLQYTDTASNNAGKTYHYDLKGKVNYISGGLIIGAQWIAKGGFTFDWWIGGGGYGPLTFSANVNDVAVGNLSDSDKQSIQDSFSSQQGFLNKASVTFSGNNIDIKARTTVPSFRGGICLGWAF